MALIMKKVNQSDLGEDRKKAILEDLRKKALSELRSTFVRMMAGGSYG